MTEEQKIQDLLNPRIKIINEDTSGNLKKDQIIPFDDETGLYWVNGEPMGQEKIDRFPHLFQPLPWWAERSEGEMPEYVRIEKLEYQGQPYRVDNIIKVQKWVLLSTTWYVVQKLKTEWELHPACLAIATEAEYISYINNKQKRQ